MLSITEVYKGVFHLEFDTCIEVAAHFLRFQEFYESPNPRIKGQPFQLLDYIKWYASEHGDVFSYFDDWAGFNIPAQVVVDCYTETRDVNDHDRFMHLVALKALARHPTAYLIGTSKESDDLDHEIAHGLFYVNPEYRSEVAKLTRALPKKVRQLLRTTISDMGYGDAVIDDEMQAYLATGLTSKMKLAEPYRKPFIEAFQRFTEKE